MNVSLVALNVAEQRTIMQNPAKQRDLSHVQKVFPISCGHNNIQS